jgi:hypothetical protein
MESAVTQFRSIPSRRAVVFGLTTILFSVFPAVVGIYFDRRMFPLSKLHSRWLTGTFVNASTSFRQSVARIGRHYLRMVPGEKNIDVLLALILKKLPDEGPMRNRNGDDVSDPVAKSIKDDFESGRIFQVKGWVLSRTEARLAGLASMT